MTRGDGIRAGAMPKLLKIVLPLVILALGLAGAGYLEATKPEVSPAEPLERVWTVNVAEVAYGDQRPELSLYGVVVAGREVEMRALVAGQVIEVGENFVDGGTMRAGALLVAIDPFEYRAALDERRAQLTEAEARLKEIEAHHRAEGQSLERDLEQLEVTGRDLARIDKLHGKGTVSAKSLDNAIMAHSKQRQMVGARRNAVAAEEARVDQQRAVIERRGVAVRRARRDLERTRVMAPFDAFVLDIQAELGKRVGVNDRLAQLVDAGRLEVSFQLSDVQFGRILEAEGGFKGRPAAVTWRTGDHGLEFAATVDRVGPRIEAASGGVHLFARLLHVGLERPLRPGAFVEVRIPDRAYAGVARLPESALHGGDTVYVVSQGRVGARQVVVVARDGDHVLIESGLAEGERAIITRFPEIGPGLKVEVR